MTGLPRTMFGMEHPARVGVSEASNSKSGEDGFGTRVERPDRLSDKVADAMLGTILTRGLRPGSSLPSERELGEQYGVSRTVVREAVRALSAKGVVVSRAGRGLMVAAVGAEEVSASLQLYLHGREEMPYTQVHEVRSVLEIQIAGLAAERGTDEEIAELEQLCEEMKRAGSDIEFQARTDVEFHRTLARMTHNELYLILLDSIGAILLEIRRATFVKREEMEQAYSPHRQIADRVKAHDAAGAREAMRKHLNEALKEWEALGSPVHLRTATAATREG